MLCESSFTSPGGVTCVRISSQDKKGLQELRCYMKGGLGGGDQVRLNDTAYGEGPSFYRHSPRFYGPVKDPSPPRCSSIYIYDDMMMCKQKMKIFSCLKDRSENISGRRLENVLIGFISHTYQRVNSGDFLLATFTLSF